MTGRKLSKSHRENIGKAALGRKHLHAQAAKDKISEVKKGFKHSEVTKEKIRETHLSKKIRGEKHWNWKGGVAQECRSSQDYQVWILKVYAKDHYTCQKCR